MDALRLSLLIFGALAIGGVYLWTSHLQQKKRQKNTGWEGPDSHTIQNMDFDNSDVIINPDEHQFSPHGEDPDTGVEKIYTQDVAKESIVFNDTGEFTAMTHVISEVKSNKDDEQIPSVFVKPKIYTSTLDQTKSHIKAVQESERVRERQQQLETKTKGLVIVINLMARPGLDFKGENILSAVGHTQLKYGEMNIFHCSGHTESGNMKHIFSLANIVNPGTFDLNDMTNLTTPGLTLFMQLPGPEEGLKVFEKMLSTAQSLKKDLDGELCDESRSALTYQTISHLKEKIKDYSFKYQQVF